MAKEKPAKRKPKSAPLSSDAIIAAAIDLLDREGLDNFSIRNIAKALGVYPTALYWHVPSRHLLIARLIAALFADVLPEPGPDWQVWLKALFRRYRDVVRTHPNISPLIGGHLVSSASADLKLVEGILATLARAGFAGEDLVSAYNAVITGLCGYATQEFAHVFPDPDGDLKASLTASVEAADPALYPTLAAERHLLLNRALVLRWQNGTESSLEPGFEMFTDALIAGLAQKVQRDGNLE
ncbi:TetR/AcrR family transcriptional regulator [Nisaea sp.]|uniref:TetR/AcrR family transcriptional regulator n=1 Tax=Nisaea sp. TaxID=2024842 RepID=UPI002B269DF3|nr:TetR family transcriptional regulator [Nisaea sp.]